MYKLLPLIGSVALFSLALPAAGAHWKLVSVGDGLLGFIGGPGASRSARMQTTVTINTGPLKQEIYGTGPFVFYGENDYLADMKTGGGSMYSYASSTSSYYQYVYQWVSDSPNDIPPPPGHDLGVNGYQLDRIQSIGCQISVFGDMVSNGRQMAIDFLTAQQLVLYPNGTPPKAWPNPQTTGWDQVQVNNQAFALAPIVVGGAVISQNGSITYATIPNALNTMNGNWTATFTPGPSGNGYWTVISGVQTTAYIGPSQIGGLAVKPN
ncbi:MAG: hypothetical protein P4L46_01385 [Fimbriimonas sp.]|nr:hypothetical protein [Fimbriimonas sp.]